MSLLLLALFTASASAPSSAAPTAPKTIAVLEVRTGATDSKAQGTSTMPAEGALPPAVRAQARYLSQVLRAEFNRELPHLIMMTRENMVILLQNSGRELDECESECEVETGHRLGVDLVVTSELVALGKELRLVVSLFDTRTAGMIRSGRASGADVIEIEKAIPAVAHQIAEEVPGRPEQPVLEGTIRGSGVPLPSGGRRNLSTIMRHRFVGIIEPLVRSGHLQS